MSAHSFMYRPGPARHSRVLVAVALGICGALSGPIGWADTLPAADTVASVGHGGESSGGPSSDRAGQAEADPAAPSTATTGESTSTAGVPTDTASVSATAVGAAGQASLASVQATIKQSFSRRFPGLSIGEVSRTPFDGVYEIPVQGELFYVDATGRYVLQGSLIDLETRTDLTAERMAKLNAIPFESLPLASAVTQVRGTGARKIAIFEDPNCGYCKQFHRTLERFDDITIYSIMFPILAPDSREKAEHIMCASDPVAVLRAWMLDGQTPPQATCETNIDELLAFGKQHNVRGTPAVFFEDGTRVGGAMTFDQLTRRLAEVKTQP